MAELTMSQFSVEGGQPQNRNCDTDVGYCGCGGYHGTRYANLIQSLNVGDSAFLPAADVGRWFPTEARRQAKKLDIILSVYRRTEDGIDGWRIWRNE